MESVEADDDKIYPATLALKISHWLALNTKHSNSDHDGSPFLLK
jgi:hypothetical protein